MDFRLRQSLAFEEEENVVVISFLEDGSRREVCLVADGKVEQVKAMIDVLVEVSSEATERLSEELLLPVEEGHSSLLQATQEKTGSRRDKLRDHEGWLFKNGGDGSFTRYLFHLIGEKTLVYYADEAARDSDLVQGYLDLTQLLQVRTTGHTVPSMFGDELTTFRLEITHGRSWELGASDPVDAMLWLTRLSKLCSAHVSPRKVPSNSKTDKPGVGGIHRLHDALACFEGDRRSSVDPQALSGKERALTQALLEMLREIDQPKRNRTETSAFVAEQLKTIEEEIFGSSEILEKSIRAAIGSHMQTTRSLKSLTQSFEDAQKERVQYAQRLKGLVGGDDSLSEDTDSTELSPRKLVSPRAPIDPRIPWKKSVATGAKRSPSVENIFSGSPTSCSGGGIGGSAPAGIGGSAPALPQLPPPRQISPRRTQVQPGAVRKRADSGSFESSSKQEPIPAAQGNIAPPTQEKNPPEIGNVAAREEVTSVLDDLSQLLDSADLRGWRTDHEKKE